MRYHLRKFESGWAVWDSTTGAPAVLEGREQIALSMDDADDLTDLLNRLDAETRTAAIQ